MKLFNKKKTKKQEETPNKIVFKQQEENKAEDIENEEEQTDFISSKQTQAEGLDFVAPSYIKETLPSDETLGHARVNDYLVEIGGTTEPVRYFRNFFAEITGGSTCIGMLDPLLLGNYGAADVDVAIHIGPVDTTDELADVARRIRGIRSDLHRETDEERIDKLRDEYYDLKARQRRLRQNIEKPFRVSIQAVTSATDLKALKKYTNNMIRRFAGNDIIMRSPDGKQLNALLNITPLGQDFMYKEHTFSYESSNVADLFPFGNGKISHTTGIVWGLDHLGRPIFYDGWHPSLMNHNIVVLGRSGGGKTFATLCLINRDTIRGISHIIIDPKGDYRNYVLAMKCPYIDLSPGSPDKINFFDVDIEENEQGQVYVNIENTVQAARAIIFKMIRLMDENVLTGKVKVRIENKIRELYAEKGITSHPDSLYQQTKTVIEKDGKTTFQMGKVYKKMPQLGDLYLKLLNDEELKDVAELLRNFTLHGDSPSQSFFDTQSTVKLKNAPIAGFGLDKLDAEVMKPLGIFIATKWISTKFARKNRTVRKRVVVDEAQIIMEDEESAIWLENEYRLVRFFNTSMMAVTQGFEVYMRIPQGIGILKNAPTKLFLKQDPIDIEEVKGKFDLTEWEADFLVSTAEKGLGILRIDEESSQIFIDSSKEEFPLFDTDPNNLAKQPAVGVQ